MLQASGLGPSHTQRVNLRKAGQPVDGRGSLYSPAVSVLGFAVSVRLFYHLFDHEPQEVDPAQPYRGTSLIRNRPSPIGPQ